MGCSGELGIGTTPLECQNCGIYTNTQQRGNTCRANGSLGQIGWTTVLEEEHDHSRISTQQMVSPLGAGLPHRRSSPAFKTPTAQL